MNSNTTRNNETLRDSALSELHNANRLVIDKEVMNNSHPTISVIVPIYNVAQFLPQCLDSICTQSYKNIEIILVDDGSTDQSGSIVDAYAEQDSRIRVVHKGNAGVSAARNDGIALARGQFAYIMDSDDYLESEALEVLLKKAMETDADIVFADHYTFFQETQQHISHFFSEEFVSSDRSFIDAIQCMVLHSGYSPLLTRENTGLGIAAPWTKLIKMDLIKNNDLQFDSYVEGIFDDGIFTLETLQVACCVAYTRTPIYHYRKLEVSLIHKYNPRRQEINKKVFDCIYRFAQQNNKDRVFYNAFNGRVVVFLLGLLRVNYLHPSCELPYKQQYKEFRQLCNEEPYKEALDRVEIKRLKQKEKILVKAARLHMFAPLWLALRLYSSNHSWGYSR